MQGNQQKVQQKQSEKQDSACFNTIGQAGMVVEDTHSFLDSTIATTVMGNKREEEEKKGMQLLNGVNDGVTFLHFWGGAL